MNEIASEILSMKWLVLSFCCGVFVNVFSAFVKDWLVKDGNKGKALRTARARRFHAEMEAAADVIRGDPYSIIVRYHIATQERVRGIGCMLAGMLVFTNSFGHGRAVDLPLAMISGWLMGKGLVLQSLADKIAGIATRACKANPDGEKGEPLPGGKQ